jgi:hypothetical protein
MLEYAKLLHDAFGVHWPRTFIVGSAVLGALIFGGIAALLVLAARNEAKRNPAQAAGIFEGRGVNGATTEQAPLPPGGQVTKETRPEAQGQSPQKPKQNNPKQNNPKQNTPKQTIINSPGAIQAGRDVVIASDKRIIQSVSLRAFIETDTAPTAISEPQTDVGLQSVIALFTDNKTRIRFNSDWNVVDHQVGVTRRRLSLVYAPETPNEILGKDISYLASITLLAVNYEEIFNIEHFDTSADHTRLHVDVVVNGISVAGIDIGVQPSGILNHGQANTSVAEQFGNIPAVYASVVSR